MVWLHVGYGATVHLIDRIRTLLQKSCRRNKKQKILILQRLVRSVCCSIGQFVRLVLECDTVASHDLL